MKSWLAATLASAVLAAYAPFPVQIPTAGQATLPRAPLGFAFVNINGGGYAVGSATSPTLGWLSEDGSWSANVWTDSDALFAAYSTVWAVKWEPELGNSNDYGVLLVTRVDLTSGMSALSVVDPFTWTTVWSVVLGPGLAFDVDSTDSGYVFATNGYGGVWSFSYSYSSAPSTLYYGNNSMLAPTTAGSFGFGSSGVVAVDSSTAVVSIAEPGVSKPRFYCLDASSSDPTQWTYAPLVLAGVATDLEALSFTGAWGLVSYTYGTNDVIGFISAPRGYGTITLTAGAGWCASDATYALGIWNASGATADPTAAGNVFVAQAYNCDLNITVALGTTFNGLPSYPATAPVSPYGLYVAAGVLPFSVPEGFVAGNDCHNAIPVSASLVPGTVYDMACYAGARVNNPFRNPSGYGIWFFVNTTGLVGSWSFTTRTLGTNFDNYQIFFDQCPTACDDAPFGYTTLITSNDDSTPSSQPDCAASGGTTSGLCSEYTFDLTATPRAGVYVLLSFLSASTAFDGELHTSSFQVLPLDATPSNALPFPTQVCDPRITVPAPPTPESSAPLAGGSSNSAPARSLF